jgi:hypothetical protein
MNKHIRTEIIINASKEKVWGILTDFANYPSWNPFIRSIKGELTPGGKLVNTLFTGKKNMVFKPKVISVTPNRYFDWIGNLIVPGLFDGHHYFQIAELGGGQVQLNHGEHFSGLLAGYILRKIANDTRASFILMNQAIRDLAEHGQSVNI